MENALACICFSQVRPLYCGFVLAAGPGEGGAGLCPFSIPEKPQAAGVKVHVYLCLGFQKGAFVLCWKPSSQAALGVFCFSSPVNGTLDRRFSEFH